MHGIARILLFLGVTFLVAGLVVLGFGRQNLSLGRLPGDLNWRGRNWAVSFPIVSCLLLSGLVSLGLWIVSRLRH